MHGPVPHSHDYAFPRKKLLGALRSAIASKINDGKLTVVENFETAEGKTKLFRTALNKLDAKKTALLVESGTTLSKNLMLGARNLHGVELMLSNEVHPYHLLKHQRAIISVTAMEQLQEALKKTVSKRKLAAAAEVA